jgi:hypothetical protein
MRLGKALHTARRTAYLAAFGALTAVHAARVRELQANIASDPLDWMSKRELEVARDRYVRATTALRRWHLEGGA